MKNKIKILFVVMVLLLASLISNYVLAEEKDFDSDGIPDSIDKYPFDYDNDGMPDIWEKRNGLRYDSDDANQDYDNDGIKNIDEYNGGTDPWVSDKTIKGLIKPGILLSPAEKTIARSLIWIGIILFLILVVIVIKYRPHFLTIFRFMHHVSKEHFARRNLPPARPVYPGYGTMPVQRRPVERIPIQPVQRQATGSQPVQPVQRQAMERQPTETQYAERVPGGQEQYAAESTEEQKDVFNRLSGHVDKYNRLKEVES